MVLGRNWDAFLQRELDRGIRPGLGVFLPQELQKNAGVSCGRRRQAGEEFIQFRMGNALPPSGRPNGLLLQLCVPF